MTVGLFVLFLVLWSIPLSHHALVCRSLTDRKFRRHI